ncbi:futalosine hydrolase [Fundidesulfovibrio putealis]|uniref:futalosine hydrolase n=1 Tax=Fundidesulfovibrio putealis TaxID=270496 RepID=UPI0004046B72|nr:futalosine hydrolase [Fundidesulfovibrio putealis]
MTSHPAPKRLLALVTATAVEMRAALAGISAGAAGYAVPERGAAVADIFGRDALLVVTGVGPVNAALEMGAVLGRYDISGVLNLGLAGSFDLTAAPLESVVAASREGFPEYGVVSGEEPADASGFPFPQWEDAAGRVLQSLELAPDDDAAELGLVLPDTVRRGAALTVAGVTGSFERARAMAERHGALTESMEGFALALACRTRQTPFLEVRTISNRVGERDRTNWKLKQALEGLGSALAGLFPARTPQTNRG